MIAALKRVVDKPSPAERKAAMGAAVLNSGNWAAPSAKEDDGLVEENAAEEVVSDFGGPSGGVPIISQKHLRYLELTHSRDDLRGRQCPSNNANFSSRLILFITIVPAEIREPLPPPELHRQLDP
jgi:hypothetical protein